MIVGSIVLVVNECPLVDYDIELGGVAAGHYECPYSDEEFE